MSIQTDRGIEPAAGWEPATPHPDPLVRAKIADAFRLKVAPLARLLGLSRPHLHHVLAGTAPMTRDIAYRIEALTGIDADTVIRMQAAYDREAELPLRARHRAEIARLTPKGPSPGSR